MYYGVEDFLEKKASRAWKRNWGNLSDDAVQRLNSSGVFDNDRELSGLQKAVKNMVERYGGRIYSSPHSRYDVNRFYKTDNGQKVLEKYIDFANQTSASGGADLVEAKNAAADYITKQIIHDDGAFAMPGAGVYISPKMDEYIMGIMENGNTNDSVKRFSKNEREWLAALVAKHEAREFSSIAKHGITFNALNNNLGNHAHPSVIVGEGVDAAMAPKNVQNVMNKLRQYDGTVGLYNKGQRRLNAIFDKNFLKSHIKNKTLEKK